MRLRCRARSCCSPEPRSLRRTSSRRPSAISPHLSPYLPISHVEQAGRPPPSLHLRLRASISASEPTPEHACRDGWAHTRLRRAGGAAGVGSGAAPRLAHPRRVVRRGAPRDLETSGLPRRRAARPVLEPSRNRPVGAALSARRRAGAARPKSSSVPRPGHVPDTSSPCRRAGAARPFWRGARVRRLREATRDGSREGAEREPRGSRLRDARLPDTSMTHP